MTIEEFNHLSEERKRVIIFEADKVAEKMNEYTRFELFVYQDFFIETRTSINYNGKRAVATYTLQSLPLMYAANVLQRM